MNETEIPHIRNLLPAGVAMRLRQRLAELGSRATTKVAVRERGLHLGN